MTTALPLNSMMQAAANSGLLKLGRVKRDGTLKARPYSRPALPRLRRGQPPYRHVDMVTGQVLYGRS